MKIKITDIHPSSVNPPQASRFHFLVLGFVRGKAYKCIEPKTHPFHYPPGMSDSEMARYVPFQYSQFSYQSNWSRLCKDIASSSSKHLGREVPWEEVKQWFLQPEPEAHRLKRERKEAAGRARLEARRAQNQSQRAVG